MTSDRLPPHDDETEAALLGCLLLGNRDASVDVLAQHRDMAGYFYAVAHQAIFPAIRDLIDAGDPVDVITTKARLEKQGTLADAGGLEYLESLPDRPPSAWNAPY